MINALLADFVVVMHMCFVLFAVFGGLLVLYRPRWAWMHLPAVVWAVLVEATGWICPLTPLENHLRLMAGRNPYQSDFIAHYVIPVLYPEGLARHHQVWLGIGVLVLNLILYGWILRRRTRS